RLDHNIYIQPSDVVYIPPGDVFYISGEVKAPGQFPVRQGITLRQAISLAGGTLFKAKLDKGIIFRTDPVTGNFTEVPVDIGAVTSGKKPDIPILGNDVIWVPNSALKAVGATFLNTLIPTAIYRIPWRQMARPAGEWLARSNFMADERADLGKALTPEETALMRPLVTSRPGGPPYDQGYTNYGVDPNTESIHLRELWRIVRKRKWLGSLISGGAPILRTN